MDLNRITEGKRVTIGLLRAHILASDHSVIRILHTQKIPL